MAIDFINSLKNHNFIRRLYRRRRGSDSVNFSSPLSLPNLVLWLDAQDTSTLWTDAEKTTNPTTLNDPIEVWDDKSGNANHLTSAGSDPAAYNDGGELGGDTVRNTSDLVQYQASGNMSVVQPFHLFIVLRPTTTGDRHVFGFSDTDDIPSGDVRVSNNSYAINAGTELSDSTTINFDTNYVFECRFNGASSYISLNNNSESGDAGSTDPSSGDKFTLFDDGSQSTFTVWRGDIGEVILTNSILSSAWVTEVRSYLEGRWSVSLN